MKRVCVHRLFLCLVVFCVLFTQGCIQSRVLIKVKEDGSGNIVVTQMFSKQMVDMVMKQITQMRTQMAASGMGGGMELPEDPFFDEEGLKRDAGKFGSGVRYVKAKKVDKGETQGFVALYAFDNINDVFIDMGNMGDGANLAPSMGMDDTAAERGEDAIWFKLAPGSKKELKIMMPDLGEPASADSDESPESGAAADDPDAPVDIMTMQMLMSGGNPLGLTGSETNAELMKKLFGGISMNISVEVDGELQKTTAQHRHAEKKGRIVLLDVDMDKLLDSPEGLKKLQGAQAMMGDMSQTGQLAAMADLPGMTVELQREVSMVFK